MIAQPPIAERDLSDGEATALVAELLAAGALEVADVGPGSGADRLLWTPDGLRSREAFAGALLLGGWTARFQLVEPPAQDAVCRRPSQNR